MKKLTTIAKIGEAALTRLFNPHYICNAMEQSSCDVVFPKQQIYELDDEINVACNNSHYGNLQFKSGRGYSVWGIGIGHVGVPIINGDNGLDAIARLDCLRFGTVPSHFIVRDWSSDDISGEKEIYTIYRLTPQQEGSIKSYVSDRLYAEQFVEVFPAPSLPNQKKEDVFMSEILFDGGWALGSGASQEEAKESVLRNWCHNRKPVLV